MTDTLHITELSAMTRIGVHAWEQRIEQQLLIDLHIPLQVSACHDQLENTLDYDALCQCVTSYVESNTFQLIETVAENVAQLIKETFHVSQLTVSVQKPHAVKNARQIFITITR